MTQEGLNAIVMPAKQIRVIRQQVRPQDYPSTFPAAGMPTPPGGFPIPSKAGPQPLSQRVLVPLNSTYGKAPLPTTYRSVGDVSAVNPGPFSSQANVVSSVQAPPGVQYRQVAAPTVVTQDQLLLSQKAFAKQDLLNLSQRTAPCLMQSQQPLHIQHQMQQPQQLQVQPQPQPQTIVIPRHTQLGYQTVPQQRVVVQQLQQQQQHPWGYPQQQQQQQQQQQLQQIWANPAQPVQYTQPLQSVQQVQVMPSYPYQAVYGGQQQLPLGSYMQQPQQLIQVPQQPAQSLQIPPGAYISHPQQIGSQPTALADPYALSYPQAQPGLAWSRGEGAAASGDQMEGMADNSDSFINKVPTALGMSMKDCSGFVQAVSLGGYCGAKLSLRRLGFGEAHMPFDWMRTRVEGLLQWLRHDFQGFFNWTNRFEVLQSTQRMTVYRSEMASFWHDDLEDEIDREKLRRRVQRFQDLGNDDSNRSLLFVRSAAGSEELAYSEELLQLLQSKFQTEKRRVWLLVILEDQPIVGPILHNNCPELIFWVQPRFTGKLSPYLDAPAPFEDAIVFAVQRMLGDPNGLYPNGNPDPNNGVWPWVNHSSEIFHPYSPFRANGLQDTSCGLWAGNLLLNGMVEEVMLAAFEGIDGYATLPQQPQLQPQPSMIPMQFPLGGTYLQQQQQQQLLQQPRVMMSATPPVFHQPSIVPVIAAH